MMLIGIALVRSLKEGAGTAVNKQGWKDFGIEDWIFSDQQMPIDEPLFNTERRL